MSRTSRDNVKNSSFFHIMVQGINKEYIFETRKNKEEYIKLIEKNSNLIKIMAYCIMDNHVHMLAQVDEISNLETFMRKSNTTYASYYNRENNRVGYVFRDRYKLQPIKNAKHLYLCIEYIHNNSVKACICEDKGEYEFSSYTKIYEKDITKIQNKIEDILQQSMINISDEQDQTEEFKLIEDEKENKSEICEKIISNFLQNSELDQNQIKKDFTKLTDLVEILHDMNGISYKMIEEYLKISREKLRKLNTKTKIKQHL